MEGGEGGQNHGGKPKTEGKKRTSSTELECLAPSRLTALAGSVWVEGGQAEKPEKQASEDQK